MKKLNNAEQEAVNGGLRTFAIGYAVSKVIDVAIDGLISHGMDMSRADHSLSNKHFLDNRDKFNLML